MAILALVAPLDEPYDSTFLTTSRPSTTEPKTTCLPSSHEVFSVQMKNWEPLLWYVVSGRRESWRGVNVRVGAGVGHGEDTGAGVLELEVLVLELLAVDGLATGALNRVSAVCSVSVNGGEALGTHVAGGEVTTLEHELGDDAVEGSALEVKGLAAAALALLSGAESAEVLSSLWPDTLVDNL
jgi:hypothetical protein